MPWINHHESHSSFNENFFVWQSSRVAPVYVSVGEKERKAPVVIPSRMKYHGRDRKKNVKSLYYVS